MAERCRPDERDARVPPPMSGLADREFMKQPVRSAYSSARADRPGAANLCTRSTGRCRHWDDLATHRTCLASSCCRSTSPSAARSRWPTRTAGIARPLVIRARLQQTLLLLAPLRNPGGAALTSRMPPGDPAPAQTYNLLIQVAEQQGRRSSRQPFRSRLNEAESMACRCVTADRCRYACASCESQRSAGFDAS